MNDKERLKQITERLFEIDAAKKAAPLKSQGNFLPEKAMLEQEQFSLNNEQAIIYLNQPELRPTQPRTQQYTAAKLQERIDEDNRNEYRKQHPTC